MQKIKISQLIDKVLFDQNCGYYKTKNPIGKNSDFITAPEISQIFGEVITLYALQVLQNLGSNISFVEMGAGRGTLLRDILQTVVNLSKKNNSQALDFFERTQFHIIEINPILRAIQKENLKAFSVNWHEDFAKFLDQNSNEIFFISNELFDCFAIDQYIKTEIGWRERIVEFEVDAESEYYFKNPFFVLENYSQKTQNFVEDKLGVLVAQKAPLNSVFEHSESAQKFMAQLCEALKMFNGIAINFDYGYNFYEFANTLQATKNHKKITFFEGLKDADITSHVDFVALDRIAKSFFLNSSLISQGEFLLSLGAKERRDKLISQNLSMAEEINSAFNRLVDNDQMGDLFKCHIIWKTL